MKYIYHDDVEEAENILQTRPFLVGGKEVYFKFSVGKSHKAVLYSFESLTPTVIPNGKSFRCEIPNEDTAGIIIADLIQCDLERYIRYMESAADDEPPVIERTEGGYATASSTFVDIGGGDYERRYTPDADTETETDE